jgi:NADH:ubiquinone oxidoreductase subunit E
MTDILQLKIARRLLKGQSHRKIAEQLNVSINVVARYAEMDDSYRNVERYFCGGCRQWVCLKPCPLCRARASKTREGVR